MLNIAERRQSSERLKDERPAQRQRVETPMNVRNPVNPNRRQGLAPRVRPQQRDSSIGFNRPFGASSLYENDAQPVGAPPPDPITFIWTISTVTKYAARYGDRARLCGYEDGMRAARQRPQEMARLQLDWENQRYLASQAGDAAMESLGQNMAQMHLEMAAAEREQANRLNAARSDGAQALGYTPAAFQTPRAPITANVPRGPVEEEVDDREDTLSSLGSNWA